MYTSMKDGYYLSTYLDIDSLCNLTQAVRRHDLNVSLWKKAGDEITLVHYWELERVSGSKHHGQALCDLPQAVSLINRLLQPYRLSLEDMVEVWGTPGLATVDDYHSLQDYEPVSYHSVAHLFSGILYDTDIFYRCNIIGLGIDGGPDRILESDLTQRGWFSGCVVRQGKIDVFPVDSPGILWSVAAERFGMEEGSLMALATASTSQANLIEDVYANPDGKVFNDPPHFFKKLVGDVTELSKNGKGPRFNGLDPRFSREENIISMVMKQIQTMSIQKVEQTIDWIVREYRLDPADTYLSLTGGYALNCPTNSYLMNKFGFKDLLFPPCVNDGGQSLGIALYAFYKKMPGHVLNFKFASAYMGDSDEHWTDLDNKGEYVRFVDSVSDFDLKQLVADLKEYPIVWFNGRSEVGPRALGNRSILGDPRQPASQLILNKIKQRQWWRPVAPVVLEEKASDWFECVVPSPFMLRTFRIKDDRLESIPAIAHLDHSARIQTVNLEQNPALYQAIQAFETETGVPMLCNTSLNDKGEPIVNRIEEAVNFCLRKRIKVGYFNRKRICFKNFDEYTVAGPLPRQAGLFELPAARRVQLLRELNPHSLDQTSLKIYAESMLLRSTFDLKNGKDAQEVAEFAKVWEKTHAV